ncbi:MAG: hypothetical protein IJM79_05910 [Erysipelotrichaceae bacterium]|nr:hypothetical protein [Erysipelotrichaceae bacterium]
MDEYMKRLFRICRRRYGSVEKLIQADDEHRFWAVQSGYPVCSRKTVYNLEEGHGDTDEDIVEFLIGKLGFRYKSGNRETDRLKETAVRLKGAIAAGEVREVERLKQMTDTPDCEGVFLFDIWQLLLQAVCDFYLQNSFDRFRILETRGVDESVLTPEMKFLYRYVKAFHKVFVQGDLAAAGRLIGQLEGISGYDLAFLIIGQTESEQLLGLMCSQLSRRIAALEDRAKGRMLYWMKAAVSTSAYCHRKLTEADDRKMLNETARKIEENRIWPDRLLLREIRNSHNPLLNSLCRRRALTLVRSSRRYRILYDIIEQLEL